MPTSQCAKTSRICLEKLDEGLDFGHFLKQKLPLRIIDWFYYEINKNMDFIHVIHVDMDRTKPNSQMI